MQAVHRCLLDPAVPVKTKILIQQLSSCFLTLPEVIISPLQLTGETMTIKISQVSFRLTPLDSFKPTSTQSGGWGGDTTSTKGAATTHRLPFAGSHSGLRLSGDLDFHLLDSSIWTGRHWPKYLFLSFILHEGLPLRSLQLQQVSHKKHNHHSYLLNLAPFCGKYLKEKKRV